MYKIGIVGFGFVGKAIAYGFNTHAEIFTYDKYGDCTHTLEETVENSDIIFVCVPTPMNEDGTQDLSNMDDAIEAIHKCAGMNPKIIIIKSTVLPGTVRIYQENNPIHTFVFNPEFLTERVAKLDFINQNRIILGFEQDAFETVSEEIKTVVDIYRTRFPHTPMYVTNFETAELIKYMCNTFFAVKLSFLNEMYDVADKLNIDFDELICMFLADNRIGNSHTDVPGHDGMRGWGGKCFPKDIAAFIQWSDKNEIDLDMCKAAQKVNDRVRPEKDWENIKGATSKNNYEKN